MSRLVVVLPLSPLRDGDRFAVRHWPLHITVVPPFLTEGEPVEVAAAIASAARNQHGLTVVAGQDEMFGRRHDVRVTTVLEDEALTHLHRNLIDAVRPLAASPAEPALTRGDFRPHVTIKGDARVHEGDVLSLTQIAVVDMAPREAPGGRTVLATVLLDAPQPAP
jgi:2'-5' RNA ligase